MGILPQLRQRISVTLEHVCIPRLLCARVVTTAVLLCAVVGVGSMPLAAAAAPGGAATLCTNSDKRLAEVSGLVATPSGYAAVNHGGNELVVLALDRECSISRILISPQDPFDPADLARTADGTLWVADTGDNDRERTAVVIWEVNPSNGAATRHRLTYPDGPHDAQAMLMSSDKTPVVVTKEPSGTAKVYVAAQPLSTRTADLGALRAAGTVTITAGGTPGGPTDAGRTAGLSVTGGAVAPDGKHAVLRTYTDAFEWQLGSGNTAGAIARTLTSDKPNRTPLPNEPRGESISYTLDNAGFITLSQGVEQPLQQWKPARSAAGSDKGSTKDAGASGGGIGLPELNRANLVRGISAVAIAGALLLASGITGVVRWRRSRPRVDRRAERSEDDAGMEVFQPSASAPAGPYEPAGPTLYPPGSAHREITAGPVGTVYGAPHSSGEAPAGASPISGSKRGTVYGRSEPS